MGHDIQTKVREILAELAMLDMKDVTADSTLEELSVDSMALVEAIFALEEAFDIQVPFNANEPAMGDFDVSSVAAITAGVTKLVAEQH